MCIHVRLCCAALIAAGLTTPVFAQSSGAPADLSMATLEELMTIEVTSASRIVQRADSVPAAVFVLTADDIRRSGMTRLPDLLRLVPGAQVATINASKWAVSVRGFNDLYADKLLVLVDGRTVYSRMFSGVLWDTEDLMLENIDRIEVIRGPGASIWGANAVNGVINIVTKSSADTQGTSARLSAGSFDQTSAAIRHGGAWGASTYRAYSQWSEGRESDLPGGSGAGDRLRTVTGGVRLDRSRGPHTFMVDSRLSAGRATALWLNLDPATGPSAPVASAGSDTLGGAVVARWTRALAGGASVQVQASFDGDRRDEPVAYYSRRSLNADAQYHTRIASRHNVVAGFEFRSMHDAFDGRAGYALTPDRSDDALVSAFAQDEVTLVPRRLLATLGTKVEHDGGIGNGLQPTARLIWHVVPDHQHLWAAVSRALRTPSLDDRAIRLDFLPQPGPGGLPVIVRILGNPDIHTEAVVETEAGYRTDIGRTAALDVAVYRGRYDRLQTQEPLDPVVLFSPAPTIVQPVRFDTLLAATTWGTEIAGQWQPTASWRLNGSYALFRIDSRLNPASRDPLSSTYQGDAPRHQWQVHGARVVGAHLRLDGMLFHVGSLADLGVPAYTRADGRVELMLNARWSIALVGQNLADGRHAEFSGARDNLVATTVPRSIGLWLTVQR